MLLIWRGGRPRDFELKLDYRITAAGNSGINYRSAIVPDPVTPSNAFAMRGYQFDLDGAKRYAGNNYEEKGRLFVGVRGQVTRIVGTRPPVVLSTFGDANELASIATDDWNAVHLVIRGNTLVHMLNGLFKLLLVGRHADRATVLRFGVPAVAAALAGAFVLQWLAGLPPLHRYMAFGRALQVLPANLLVGMALAAFALMEVIPRLRAVSFSANWMPLGGLLSGGLGELVDSFKRNGYGDVADSWVSTGPNKQVETSQLEQAIGPDVLQQLTQQTGLSREDILARLSRDLPDAVDKYTPDGRLPT